MFIAGQDGKSLYNLDQVSYMNCYNNDICFQVGGELITVASYENHDIAIQRFAECIGAIGNNQRLFQFPPKGGVPNAD